MKDQSLQQLSHFCNTTCSTFANSRHGRDRSPAPMKIEVTYQISIRCQTKVIQHQLTVIYSFVRMGALCQ
jgi:hypothetical protein